MTLPASLVFVDLETTGANPLVDRITEIGIVELTDGQMSQWSTLVNPQADIPPFIQQLTGITPSMVADAPTFEELAEEVLARLAGRVFVAHNARFDYGFLKASFRRVARDFRAQVLCTVKLSRKLYPAFHKHNLDSLVERHSLAVTGDRHRALADADVLRQFWQLTEREIELELREAAVAHLLKTPTLPPNLDPAWLEELPEGPGVYLFYAENDLPLYVGKSTGIRNRVLAHFASDHRISKEMSLAQQVRRIECRETVGELGALLLESRLVKELQPTLNRQLRRNTDLCAWQVEAVDGNGDFRPKLVYARDLEMGRQDNLFGLFPSSRQAKASMRQIAEAHHLCLVTLGLEKPARGGACFGYQLKTCRGVCVGREERAFHGARLMAALAKLRLASWPWPGAVGLVETDKTSGKSEIHVVNNWCWLGSARSETDAWQLVEEGGRPAFDQDVYKILEKALRQGRLKVLPLAGSQVEKED